MTIEVNEKRVSIPFVEMLPDDELERLNKLLPWSAFVVDSKGRDFGKAYSAEKRANPQKMPDARITELNRRFPLANLEVLEVGCYEGFHTIALSKLAKRVIGIDSRIENVVKTIVRCAMFGYKPDVLYWNLENDPPEGVDVSCDVLHHMGVLYHLADPVRHLKFACERTRKVVMLDTHVAPEGCKFKEYEVDGESYRYFHYEEGDREAPFAGMMDHAKWMFVDDLVKLFKKCGFNSVDVAELRQERNGPRVLIYASKD
jgi:SAM-dependent methyltransferase